MSTVSEIDEMTMTDGTDLEMTMKMDCRATCWPGQILRPKPKGRSKSTTRGWLGLTKRSGSNDSGSGNTSGSFEIALIS